MLLILCIVIGASFSPWVQNKVANKALSELLKTDSARATVGGFHFTPFNSLQIEDFLLLDNRNDTLLFVHSLGIIIDRLEFSKNEFYLSSLELDGSNFYLKHYENEEFGNIRFLLDKFSSNSNNTNSNSPRIECETVIINDFEFVWKDYNSTSEITGVDFEDIHVDNFNSNLSQLVFFGKEVSAHVNQLNLKEKSGFIVDSLSTYCFINSDSMYFNNIHVVSPNSKFNGSYAMYHNDYTYFSDYIEKVRMTGEIQNSRVSVRDIAYFSETLIDFKEEIRGSAKFDGTVADFNAYELDLKVGKYSVLRGNVAMKGLPQIDSTVMNINLENTIFHPGDLGNIHLEAFSENLDFKIPDVIQNYGIGKVTGYFRGYYYDFSTKADVNGANGEVLANFSMNIDGKDSLLHYSGDFGPKKLRLDRILESDDFGLFSTSLHVSGKGTSKEDLNAEIEGQVYSISYKNYNYADIDIDGRFEKQLFDGKLAVNDPNLEFDFSGKMDFRPKKPKLEFKAKIDTLYPNALNLLNRDSTVFVSAVLDFDTKGLSLKDVDGCAQISDLIYSEGTKTIEVPEITVNSFENQDIRYVDIESSLVSGKMSGNYYLPDFEESFRNLIQYSLPSLTAGTASSKIDHDFDFDFQFYKINSVLNIFYPVLQIDSGLVLKGKFDGPNNFIEIDIQSNRAVYDDLELDTVHLNLLNENDKFTIGSSINEFKMNDKIHYEQIDIQLSGKNDTIDLAVKNNNQSSPNFKSDILLRGVVKGPHEFVVSFDSSYVMLADSIWVLNDKNIIEIDTGRIAFHNFKVRSNEKQIELSGGVSRDTNEVLEVNLVDLNLGNFSRIVGVEEALLGGLINGRVYLSDLYRNPQVISTIYIDDLVANQQYIGSGPLSSSWNQSLNRFDVDFDLFRPSDSVFTDTISSLKFFGYYYPTVEDTALHLVLKTDGFKIKSIEPIVSEYLNQIEGELVGEVALSGSFKKPVLEGEMMLKKCEFRIPYLNTKYYTDKQTLIFKEDWFGFNKITLSDENGQKAEAIAGTVFHENWKNLNFDVLIDVENFLSLNTGKKDNDLFYGTAYLSGWINISTGYEQKIDLELDARAINETKLFVPLYSASEVSQNDFIRFITLEEVKKDIVEEESAISGINLSFNFDIDPSTEIQLIFNEQTGEILKAQGGGEIKMMITHEGDFEMYGVYEVRNGDYLFNFENLLSKRFTLTQGGTIDFNGDPMNARIDIRADYKVKAGLDQILGDTTYSKKVDNICSMTLTDQLEKPNILFGIDVLNVDSDIEARVKSQMPTQEDVNKQVFSLLLFNNYTAPNNTFSGSGFAGATGTELLANQLNSWLSKMDNKIINVGVSELKSDNVEVELSKKMLDNRLVFESNVGVDNSNTSAENQSSNQLVGDFKLEYMIREDGKVRAKVFNRSETYSIEDQGNSATQTQGVGIFYQENFDSYGQFLKSLFTRDEEKVKERKNKKEKKKGEKSSN
ncbi:MAG: translocation/assembly module TamB domain-containing protein [Salibacteraceae bacterium]